MKNIIDELITAKRYFKVLSVFLLFVTIETGCKKFVQVDPPISGLVSKTVYTSNASAAASLTSIYDKMILDGGFSNGRASISFRIGCSADELKDYYPNDIDLLNYYKNSVTSLNASFWNELYQYIYQCNSAIEGISASTTLNPAIKQQLLGEAKFMRAFLHFYLVNLYGDVPYVTSTDYRINNVIKRTPSAKVIENIIADLKDAQKLLTNDYLTPSGITTTERVRPNKGAAVALLARVYLYNNDWTNAESEADTVINNTSSYSLESDLNNVFLKNSNEAIWQLQPVEPGYNTHDAFNFILIIPPGISGILPVAMNANLVNTFESNDMRFTNWVGTISDATQTYYYPFKYKAGGYPGSSVVTEYLMVLRLAEQYLIRAEARAQQQNISGAQADLNAIRSRAGLPNTPASDRNSLLAAIAHERQVELFSEWGHRWFDLKRTGKIDSVMSIVTPQKGGGTWSPNHALLPIPLSETKVNSNLTQNPGY